MPVINKQTTRKTSKTRKPAKIVKTKDVDEVVFFPEKLARANALLEKAILLPHDRKKEK